METFWYRLIQVYLEKWPYKLREKFCWMTNQADFYVIFVANKQATGLCLSMGNKTVIHMLYLRLCSSILVFSLKHSNMAAKHCVLNVDVMATHQFIGKEQIIILNRIRTLESVA